MKTDNGRVKLIRSTEREYCVLCGRMTDVEAEQPLAERKHYIEGAGQLCKECYQEIYVPRQNGDRIQLRQGGRRWEA